MPRTPIRRGHARSACCCTTPRWTAGRTSAGRAGRRGGRDRDRRLRVEVRVQLERRRALPHTHRAPRVRGAPPPRARPARRRPAAPRLAGHRPSAPAALAARPGPHAGAGVRRRRRRDRRRDHRPAHDRRRAAPPRLDEGLARRPCGPGPRHPRPVALAPPRTAPRRVEAAAYYVACEALTNAVKHASADAHHGVAPTSATASFASWSPTTASAAPRRSAGHRPAPASRPRRRPRRHARAGQPARRRHSDRGGVPVRVVIAEDTVLLREGLAGLLEDAGHEVVGRVGRRRRRCSPLVAEHEPDLAVVDVRMPPDYHDEGSRAAAMIRARPPGDRVPVLSQHIETRHAVELVADRRRLRLPAQRPRPRRRRLPRRRRRVAAGGSALDPKVVAHAAPPPQAPEPARRPHTARAPGARR